MFNEDIFSEWLEDNLEFKARASDYNWKMECPFCGGSEFFVSIRNGAWLCYHERKCGRRSTNPAVLVADVNGITVTEAQKYLESTEDRPVTQDMINSLMDSMRAIKPVKSPDSYVHGSQAALDMDGIFYLDPNLPGLHQIACEYLISRRFDLDWFISTYKPMVALYGRMEGRLILPHFRDNYVIFYQGRLLLESDDMPKYLNPKRDEQVVFRKDLLWNESKLHNDSATVLVTEGIFKSMAFERAGYDAVATYGSMVSEEQIQQLISCEKKSIIVVPDRGKLDKTRYGMNTFADLWREILSKKLVEWGKLVFQVTPLDKDYDEVAPEVLRLAVGEARPITNQYSV